MTLGCLSSAVVASDIGCTPASSAKMPLEPTGMPPSKSTFKCVYLALSSPEANLLASDAKMLTARSPALAFTPLIPNSTSMPFALNCNAPNGG